MIKRTRRYVFLDFDTLISIKFKKLEKVCDKIFVFVHSNVINVPFVLVRDMQNMGNAVKWVEVGAVLEQDSNYHICFLMGKLHEKISGEVEFAILSNDTSFDPLVNFINSTGRSCVRIKNNIPSETISTQKIEPTLPLNGSSNGHEKSGIDALPPTKTTLELINTRLFGESKNGIDTEEMSEHALIQETARETVRRLVRSGNRPQNITMLRNYILLHNQELSLHGDVDKIISHLKGSKDIELSHEIVQYNF